MTEETEITIGNSLQNARKSKKITIDEVVENTNIRAVYIEAMEDNRFDELPAGIYAKGYLKTYSELLQLDSTDILEKFSKCDITITKNEEPVLYSDDITPSPLVIIFSLFAAIIIYGLWFMNNQEEVIVPVDKHTEKVVAIYNNPTPTVTLVAKADVKITVLNGDVVFTEEEMKTGGTFFLPEQDNLILKTDNPEAIEIYVNGDLVVATDNLEKQENGNTILSISKLLAGLDIK